MDWAQRFGVAGGVGVGAGAMNWEMIAAILAGATLVRIQTVIDKLNHLASQVAALDSRVTKLEAATKENPQ